MTDNDRLNAAAAAVSESTEEYSGKSAGADHGVLRSPQGAGGIDSRNAAESCAVRCT